MKSFKEWFNEQWDDQNPSPAPTDDFDEDTQKRYDDLLARGYTPREAIKALAEGRDE